MWNWHRLKLMTSSSDPNPEYFGTPQQQQLQRRGEHLWRLLRTDTRFASHGRGVQVAEHTDETLDLLLSLISLNGATGCEKVKRADVPGFINLLETHGLAAETFRIFKGSDTAVEAARDRIANRPLPDDLKLHVIDNDSPSELVQDYVSVALAQGVFPSSGSYLRGITQPGFAMVLHDSLGQPIATANAVKNNPAGSQFEHQAQWGQLATIPARQGQGIAATLGAHSIVYGREAFGIETFKTGVKEGNTSSTRLCNSLNIRDSGFNVVIGIDLEAYGAKSVTA